MGSVGSDGKLIKLPWNSNNNLSIILIVTVLYPFAVSVIYLFQKTIYLRLTWLFSSEILLPLNGTN